MPDAILGPNPTESESDALPHPPQICHWNRRHFSSRRSLGWWLAALRTGTQNQTRIRGPAQRDARRTGNLRSSLDRVHLALRPGGQRESARGHCRRRIDPRCRRAGDSRHGIRRWKRVRRPQRHSQRGRSRAAGRLHHVGAGTSGRQRGGHRRRGASDLRRPTRHGAHETCHARRAGRALVRRTTESRDRRRRLRQALRGVAGGASSGEGSRHAAGANAKGKSRHHLAAHPRRPGKYWRRLLHQRMGRQVARPRRRFADHWRRTLCRQ